MSSPMKRLRRRKEESEGEPEFQVAPMVDVLLVLLLFFMSITSTEILKKEKNLHLPHADNAKKDKKKNPNEIILNVTWDATRKVAGYTIDGNHYASSDDLQGVLQAKTSGHPNAYVLIRADKAVTYSNIADAMTACANAGIATVTFGVITGGDNNKKGGASPADD